MPQAKTFNSVDVIVCEKCGCTWFTPITINRYSALGVSLFQAPIPIHYDVPHQALMCIKCQHVVSPQFEGSETLSKNATWDLYKEIFTEKSKDSVEADKCMAGKTKIIRTFNVVDSIPSRK